jgi:hypothetical protein
MDTTSLSRRGELVRQAIQQAEHDLYAVAGEERERRCAERADGIGEDILGGREKADCHSEHRAKHEPYDVFAQVARGKETIAYTLAP